MKRLEYHVATRRLAGVRKKFAQAPKTPPYLEMDSLEELQEQYRLSKGHGYDPQSLENRAYERSRELIGLRGAKRAKSWLELGCGDGMVSWSLQRSGKDTTAVDIAAHKFDPRAVREGVKFHAADVSPLPFEDESFDFVFSYNAFEHFPQPDRALAECARVVRPGGSVFLSFGPLYMSPFGEHAYLTISVPYCQFLFSPSVLTEFAQKHGKAPIDFSCVNRWSVEQYRALWGSYSDVFRRVKYFEGCDFRHVDLIERYPSCFRSKTDCFENLIVSNITVLFENGDDRRSVEREPLGV